MKLYIGSQSSDDKKLLISVKDVVKNGGNVVQIFLRDMCTTSVKGRKNITESEQRDIRMYKKKEKIKIYVHASYLLNFCKIPVGLKRIQWAYKILAEDMILSENMRLDGVVVHMCSRKAVDNKWKPFDMTDSEAQKKMVKHITYFFQEYGSEFRDTSLLLENSASKKRKIGGTMRSLGAVVKPLRKKFGKRVGTCLDTCHAFAAGYRINTVEGMKNMLEEFERYIGPPKSFMNLIHLNDSATPSGSQIDKHAGIGDGYIFSSQKGKDSLRYIVDFAFKNSIPMCLETHSEYKKEISLIRSMIKKGGSENKVSRSYISVNKVVDVLDKLKEYHKILGNNIKASQYGKAIASLRSSGIKKIRSGEELIRLPWVGKGIADKVNEMIKKGSVSLLLEFNKDSKIRAYRDLNGVFGIGPKKAKDLVKKGVMSVSDLKKSARSGKINLTYSQMMGLKYYNDLKKKISREEAVKFKEVVLKEARSLDNNTDVVLAGSFRTGKKKIGDIDLVVITKKQKNFLRSLVKKLIKINIIKDSLIGPKIPKTDQRRYIGVGKIDKVLRHIDIHVVKPEVVPYHLLYFGSGERFSKMIRRYARSKGYKLTDTGIYKDDIALDIPDIKNEKDIFRFLGLRWVPPDKRTDVVDIKEI